MPRPRHARREFVNERCDLSSLRWRICCAYIRRNVGRQSSLMSRIIDAAGHTQWQQRYRSVGLPFLRLWTKGYIWEGHKVVGWDACQSFSRLTTEFPYGSRYVLAFPDRPSEAHELPQIFRDSLGRCISNSSVANDKSTRVFLLYVHILQSHDTVEKCCRDLLGDQFVSLPVVW